MGGNLLTSALTARPLPDDPHRGSLCSSMQSPAKNPDEHVATWPRCSPRAGCDMAENAFYRAAHAVSPKDGTLSFQPI